MPAGRLVIPSETPPPALESVGADDSGRPNSAKRCHSEPVRAAKQVPLGYTLAWESVSPRLPLRGRCQREALTEGEIPRVFLSPSRLRRQPPPRGGLPARRCRADGTSGMPSPTHGSIKTTRRPLRGAARFPSMCGTDGGGLYSPLLQAGTAGGFHLTAERALIYLETPYHVFLTSPLYTFNENMQARLSPQSHQGNQKAQGELVPFDCPSARGRRGWK